MSAESPFEDLPRRRFGDVDWQERDTKAVLGGRAVVGLSESGDSLMLIVVGFGTVRYSRERDSEAVALVLESALEQVRKAASA